MLRLSPRQGSIVIGVYAWAVTLTFGMVLLDLVYGSVVPGTRGSFGSFSDLLLMGNGLVFFPGFAANVVAWPVKKASRYLMWSVIVLPFDFVLPVTLFHVWPILAVLNLGPLIRTIPSGAAAVFAFVGQHNFHLHTLPRRYR